MSDFSLPGFELIEKIGEGGMGQVWKARQLSLDRIVAIKLLSARYSKDPESVRQIMQEARTAAKLKHPGIVQVYDAHEHNGSYYYVMEFVDGYTVGQWIGRKKLLQSADALIVAESVANALGYAWHTSELIHCDLKPENIMVDKDGTIKVADLGLSLTHDTRSTLKDDEVAGTPGYISPEQVTGESSLDCRTDIYALGCCLYHMVTGHRPFQDVPDSKAMESQVTAFLPDPRDLVPSVPVPVSALIERMMVKKRDERIKNWRTVISDIHRVQRGLMPAGPPPTPGASTVQRKVIVVTASAKSEASDQEKRSSSGILWVGFSALAIMGVAAGYWFKYGGTKPAQDVVLPVVPVVVPSNMPVHVALQPSAQPVKKTRVQPGMSPADRLAEVRDDIRKTSEDLVSEGQIERAIKWLTDYDGPQRAETAGYRDSLIKDLNRQLDNREAAKRQDSAWQAFQAEVGSGILSGRLVTVRQMLETKGREAGLASHGAEVSAIMTVLQDASVLGDKIIETYSNDVGREVIVPMSRGELKGKLVEIRDHNLVIKTMDAMVNIRVDDLAVAERQRRLGAIDRPEAYLVRGVHALAAGSAAEAVALLQKTGPVLGALLMDRVKTNPATMLTADEALAAFVRLLSAAGITAGDKQPSQWCDLIAASRIDRELAPSLDRDLDSFISSYSSSAFAGSYPEAILALRAAIGDALSNEVAREVEPKASSPVASALVSENPGLNASDIEVSPAENNGKLRVVVRSASLKTLASLDAFKDISAVSIIGPGGRCGVLDVSPLAMLPLRELTIDGYDIADPSKLRGLRLSRLEIPNIKLKSLSFLVGMPLIQLDIRGSGVSDIDALRGMKLEILRASGTRIASVTALAGMPLKELLLGATAIRDITYLQGIPLERLDLSDTQVTDLSLLRSFKLSMLNIGRVTLRDLSFCADMPLKELNLNGATVPTLAPLAGKSLQKLVIGSAAINDLSALRSIRVAVLDFSGSKLASATLGNLLAQCQCEELVLSGTLLDNLDCLRSGKTLRTLNLSDSLITDISPLAGLPIETLDIRGLALDRLEPLRQLPALRVLKTSLGRRWQVEIAMALTDLRMINDIHAEQLRREVPERATLDTGGEAVPFRK